MTRCAGSSAFTGTTGLSLPRRMRSMHRAVSDVRLFVAVPLPDEVKRAVKMRTDELVRQFQPVPSPRPLRLRMSHEEDYHLTLKFIGDAPEELVPLVEEALRDATEKCPSSFHLSLTRFGSFPGNPERTRVLWMGVDGDLGHLEKLTEVATRAAISSVRRLRETTGHKIRLHPSPFAPHITIGRVDERAQKQQRRELWDHLQSAADGDEEDRTNRFQVDQFVLFDTMRNVPGPKYRGLTSFELPT